MQELNTASNGNSREQWAAAMGGSLLLAYALRQRSWSSPFIGAAGVALLYRGATGQNPGQELVKEVTEATENGIQVKRAVTIRRSPEDVYRFWRNIENLPRFMKHLDRVEELEDGRSRWEARLPGGLPLKWEAVVIRDEPGQLLEWQTLPQAAVEHHGAVRFVPKEDGRATELHVSMSYRPPLGVVGAAVAELLNVITEQQVKEEIRHCKHLLEAGEIPTIQGQPSGRSSA